MPGDQSIGRSRCLVIEPSRGWPKIDVNELWARRDLFLYLAWRDLAVGYGQTMLGVGWAVCRPLLTMIAYSVFFGLLLRVPSEGIPYPLFIYAAILPWQYFSTVLSNSSNSLIGNAYLLSKVYLPRLLIPFSSVVPPLIDCAIGLVILLGMILAYGMSPSWNLLWLPAWLLLALTLALGAGLWLAALSVEHRDVNYFLGFFLQLWLFASPVVYPVSLIPEQWRALYRLNPMVPVIEGCRWSLLGTERPLVGSVAAAIALTIFVLFSGILFFRHREKTFVDVL
jgi:lipopolysaccharide transport system permease protein